MGKFYFIYCCKIVGFLLLLEILASSNLENISNPWDIHKQLIFSVSVLKPVELIKLGLL